MLASANFMSATIGLVRFDLIEQDITTRSFGRDLALEVIDRGGKGIGNALFRSLGSIGGELLGIDQAVGDLLIAARFLGGTFGIAGSSVGKASANVGTQLAEPSDAAKDALNVTGQMREKAVCLRGIGLAARPRRWARRPASSTCARRPRLRWRRCARVGR